MDLALHSSPMSLDQYLWSEERAAIVHALQEARHNVALAARLLQVSYRAMRYAMERLGLSLRPQANRDVVKGRRFQRSWAKLRMDALRRYGARCQCCGATAHDGVSIHVDHIKPRHTHPDLELDPDNLQVLCALCNVSKGCKDNTDWRGPASNPHADVIGH